jgi:hypothetical protein
MKVRRIIENDPRRKTNCRDSTANGLILYRRLVNACEMVIRRLWQALRSGKVKWRPVY